MAYSLQSLITILEGILNPEETRWIVDENYPQLRMLLEKATSLLQILEKSSLTKIESLESRVRDVVYKAEDIIESRMVDQMLSTPHGVSFTFFTPYLEQVMQQLDSATELVVFMAGKTMSTGSSSSSGASFSQAMQQLESLKFVEVEAKKMPAGSSSRTPTKNDLVGVEADLMQLKDRLTNTQSKLEIIPIVGMGGIGKSTPARNLYNDPDLVSHFQFRNPNGKHSDELNECNDDELKDKLYERLFGRRYMILLDDIWSTKFWDEIRMYLPDNNNGGRIVITTRNSDVAKYENSKSLHHDVHLLNESASWDLLRQIVFGEEDCPDDVQGIGTKIASDAVGFLLPLI